MKHILVVGAGPAGLFAAIGAQKAGCQILEKMSRPGIKLALTGNGRGNITNASSVKKIQQAFFEHGDFLRPALQNLSPKKLRGVLSSLGLSTIEEKQGRVFPVSMRAKDIVECLQTTLHKAQVPIFYKHRVTALCINQNKICGVKYNTGEKTDFFPARAIILACGGMAWPATGSTGDGYALARSVGHTITPCLPALAPLLIHKEQIQTLQGISLPAVLATLSIDDVPAAREHGDIIFTHFGLSGPAILDLSRIAAKALKKGQKVEVQLDLFPDTSCRQLDRDLTQLISRHGKKQVLSLLSSMFPGRLARFCLDQNNIDPCLQAGRLDAGNRKNLATWIKKMSFAITETDGFKRAMLTHGGISLEEVNAQNLESRLIKGLFFAGELLDIDGKSGGYNLQAAFSTGLLAGKSAAEKITQQGQ